MRKTSFIFAIALVSLVLSAQLFAQSHRDIAVVGHNRNNPNNPALEAPNSVFNGWFGGNADFQVFTTNPPQSFLKNKINGAQFVGCNVAQLNIPAAPPQEVNFLSFGRAELVYNLNTAGNFNVVCGNTLTGTFTRAVLHVANGSHSASITLFSDAVNYVAPTNLITNAIGNYAWTNGSLSIAIITRDPVVVTPPSVLVPTGSISGFKAFSNITFGARKI